jgi:putative DNA primase/helicase
VVRPVGAMRRPSDYEARDGARFELHFEKARGLAGDDVDPLEARMTLDDAGVVRWEWQPARQSQLDRVAALLNDGLGPKEVAHELGLSLAQTYRLRKRAMETGLLESASPGGIFLDPER